MMILVCIVLYLALAVNGSIIFEDCGSEYELRSVNIEGCGSNLPCYVTLGEDVSVNLEFYANCVPRNLDQKVVLNINHLNLKTPVNPERCASSECPVTPDALSSISSVMSVPKSIALNQRGYLRWRIENEDERQVLCYSVLVQTQSPLQKLMRQFMESIRHSSEKL